MEKTINKKGHSSTGVIITRLKLGEMFKLVEFVREHYAQSGKTDEEFATVAANTLGFAITRTNVITAREAINVPSNVTRMRTEDKGTIAHRLKNLENEVQRLEQALKELYARLGERSPPI